MIEEWKNIDGYDGDYQISNLGRVRSLKSGKETYLKGGINSGGYPYVLLYVNNNRKNCPTHTLVWEHFGNIPRNGMILQIDHIDGNKLNNRIDNLQLLNQRENSTKYFLTLKKSSKYTGVYWYTRLKKWKAQININKKRTSLGYFDNEEDAHKSYQDTLRKINNITQKQL